VENPRILDPKAAPVLTLQQHLSWPNYSTSRAGPLTGLVANGLGRFIRGMENPGERSEREAKAYLG
jgi:hypothetical protein